MFLVISDKKVPWQILEKSTVLSRHTGSELQRRTVKIFSSDPAIQAFLDVNLLFSDNKEVNSFNPTSGESQSWIVLKSDLSGDGQTQEYTLYLIEKESYQLEKLVIQDLELIPYSYSESFDRDCLTIHIKVEIPKTNEDKLLEKLQTIGYLPVIRDGINNEPTDMRFGLVYWSENGDSKKYDMTLVEKKCDEKRAVNPFTVQNLIARNTREMLVRTDCILQNLLKKLEEKHQLTGKELEEIVKVDAAGAWIKEHQLYRCEDIDNVE